MKIFRSAVLGIDPGLDGGVALMMLSDKGEPDDLVVIPMPTKPGAKNRDVDGNALARFIDDAADLEADIKLACVESVHSMPKQGVSSSFNFGKGYGRVLGVLEAQMIPIQDVTPQSWKKAVLDSLGREKADAIRFALNHFPKVNFKASDKSKNYHDGMAEAVCIAEYGRRLLIKGESSIKLEIVDKPKSEKEPVITSFIDEYGDKAWALTYNAKGRRNSLILEAQSKNEAINETVKFLAIDKEEIEVLDICQSQ